MFDHFVWSVLVAPVLVVIAVALLAHRLSPSAGVSFLTWSAVAASLSGVINLAVFTAKAAAEIPVVADHFGWSHETVIRDTAHVRWVPWLSAVLLALALVSMVLVWRRHRRAHRVALMFADLPSDQEVVFVENEAVDAFAVPGGRGRIIITTAMRDSLTGDELAVLIAHERVHLTAKHSRLILLAELASAAHPALYWVSARVSQLIERAADEQAALTIGDRRTVAKAIGTAALASSGPPLVASSPMSFARRSRPGVIPARVAGLLAPRLPEHTKWLGLIPATLAATSVLWTFEAIYDLHELLTLASR
ncbi:M56 family metallopeptidase [Streptosporangium subroseum]|uniref:M56 family metallopeptidase n=1 Tax=Streptosporangium subroseum TaxID=106412 RepID=UPI003422FB29